MVTTDPVTHIPGIGPSYQKLLQKLGIETVSDLINHFPRKYLDFSHPTNIKDLQPYSLFCLKATVVSSQNLRTKTGKTMQKVVIRDRTGTLTLTWFNQPFLLSTLKPGAEYYFVGTTKDSTYFVTPLLQEPATAATLHTNRIVPFHPLTQGLSGKWLRHKINLALNSLTIEESLPSSIITPGGLDSLSTAFHHIHFPDTDTDLNRAQTRFAFNELLELHLKLLKTKQAWKQLPCTPVPTNASLHRQFLSSLPFTPTPDQTKAMTKVLADLKQDFPANRLIQGDVGSGKTLIALAAALQALNSGLQVLLLAPTRLLASQHHQTFTNFFSPFNITPSLITSTSHPQETSNLLIGTHALLRHPKSLSSDKLGLVIFDEQQRFGVLQRNFFVNPDKTPHHLTLSATPIPRTIALSLVGHINVTNIKTLPREKKPIKTWLVPASKRTGALNWIQEQITQNHTQVFFVCPTIDPTKESSSISSIKSAVQLHDHLSTKVFPKLRLGLLHGRLPKDEQQQIIDAFHAHKIDLLVTTTVIEVGIDIKNANIIAIESADHFGLSQLHQLRGRVGRGVDQGYCLLFASDQAEEEQITRLKHLETNQDGFTLSRLDLQLRGSGSLFGTKQSGHLHTQLHQFWDQKLSQSAKKAASHLLSHHPTHPFISANSTTINLQT